VVGGSRTEGSMEGVDFRPRVRFPHIIMLSARRIFAFFATGVFIVRNMHVVVPELSFERILCRKQLPHWTALDQHDARMHEAFVWISFAPMALCSLVRPLTIDCLSLLVVDS
jgi:hypothetical protein